MMACLHIHCDDKTHTLHLPAGTTLGKALRQRGLLTQPCGSGRCGKCRILARTTPTPEEVALLGQQNIDAGVRLACYTRATDGLHLSIPEENALAVLTDLGGTTYAWSPVVEMRSFPLPRPSLDDQRGDLEAVMSAAGATRHQLTLDQLACLPCWRRKGEQGHALVVDDTLMGVTDTNDHTALIVDIGTTTVAALLVDLHTQQVLDVRGERNAQACFGADVITRIRHSMEYTEEGLGGGHDLHVAIVAQINRLLAALCGTRSPVSCIAVTGNTTMLHFFCGLSPEHVGKAPFIPALLLALRDNARRFGLHSDAPLFVMPGISAYIGGDIVASLLAADAHHATAPFLLLDLGTNAEIVLFDGEQMHACSAAAGPCFEGATLHCGMAGQKGAVTSVTRCADSVVCTVMGQGQALGLCGSAVLDSVALLLDTGALDETGRLEPLGPLASHIRKDTDRNGKEQKEAQAHNGQWVFHLTDNVILTQKDIRQVQLAKAAVAAGVDALLAQAGLAAHKVETLFLAGGFGSALFPASAARLGLFPAALTGKVRVLGNAAAHGALRYLTEAHAPAAAQEMANRVRHVELSALSAFSRAYMEHITFPGS